MLYGCFSLTATSVCISQSAVSSTCQNCTTILAMKHFSNGVATYLNVVINTYEISHIWVHVITHQMELELLWLLVPDLPLNKQVSLTWSSITLGHMMSLPIVGGTSDQRSTWPKGEVISHVATRCLFLWGHIWPLVNLTKVVSHLATRCLCLGEGQLDILLDSESATISRPTSHVQKCQPVRVGHIVGGGRTGGPDPIGPQSRVPCLPLVPLEGVTYLTKARQVTQMSSAALYIPLALLTVTVCSLYLCHLITYCCTICREILSWLFSVLTNLCISFCHQSGVLLHKGTTF